ncbi:MAG: VCBS repeat-containing protein [Vicinamibacterales bacterium]
MTRSAARTGAALGLVALCSLVVLARQTRPIDGSDAPQWRAPSSDRALAAPGLLEGDQVPDIIVGPGTGGVVTHVLDGATLAELGGGFPFGGGFGASIRTALGDVSGDGVADIVTAMGPGGSLVKLFDGVTIAEIAAGYPFGAGFGGGVSVALGDVNGDGRQDIIVGQASGGGAVRVFSGVDIALLMSVAPFGPGFSGGVNVAAGDVDGDGRSDLIVGQASGGTVAVVSAATQAVIAAGAPYGALAGGVFVAAGDVTGDGRAEVIAAPGSGTGAVLVYDVATLSVVGSFVPYAGFTGGVRVAAGDVTGDGRADIVVVPGPGRASDLVVFDGVGFAPIRSTAAYPASYTGGAFVSVTSGTAPRFTSAAATTFVAGTPATFTITTAGSPPVAQLAVTGTLPAGVSFADGGAGTATLSGAPDAGTGGASRSHCPPPTVSAHP